MKPNPTQLHALLFPCREPIDWARTPYLSIKLPKPEALHPGREIRVLVCVDRESMVDGGFVPPGFGEVAWHASAEWFEGGYPVETGALQLHALVMLRTAATAALKGVGSLPERVWQSVARVHCYRALTGDELELLSPRSCPLDRLAPSLI